MYNIAKKWVSIFPKKWVFKAEPYLRNIYAIFFIGKSVHCIICNFKARSFNVLPNKDLLCRKCGSLSRDRRLWKFLKDNSLTQSNSILEFSPSRCLYRKWKKEKSKNYIASDLSGNFMHDVSYDMTNIPVNNHSISLIIAYHILEHISNDIKAMQELYRIIKPSGKIIIQTPFKEGNIYEDFSITSEKERLQHFGQEDHVRIYSVNGLVSRLQSVGFNTEIFVLNKDNYLGFLENETIIIAKH